MSEKEILQITFTNRKLSKTKFGKWVYWNIWFQVWDIWRPKMLSKFCYMILSILSKDKENYGDIKIHIIDKTKK